MEIPHTPQVYTQVSFDGHQTTPAAVDGVVPASAPAFSSANAASAAAANSLNNGAALNTFSSVRGASSDSGRGEYVQESDCRESARVPIPSQPCDKSQVHTSL